MMLVHVLEEVRKPFENEHHEDCKPEEVAHGLTSNSVYAVGIARR
jgi:hypothetical protein